MYKAIIIDDEKLARKRVSDLLSKHQNKINVVGEADTAKQAIQMIEKEQPDLLFLDIHLPDMSGLEMLEHLSYQPKVIFTTAYQRYAIAAFEKLSIDYLMKPISQERFDTSLKKLQSLGSSLESKELMKMITQFKTNAAKKERSSFPVKKGEKILLLDFEDISYFKAEDKYVKLVTKTGKEHWIDKSLATIELETPQNFIRVHRSFIVNKELVLEVAKFFKGTLILTLKDSNNTAIKTGQSYTAKVKVALGI